MIQTEIRIVPQIIADRRNGHPYKNAESTTATEYKNIVALEEQARKKQEKHLHNETTKTVNTNFEVWADHENEKRRLSHDVFTTWKRPTVEVNKYNTVMEEIEKSGNKEALLFELINNWTTPVNFEHIASLLTFTAVDAENLWLQLETNMLQEEKSASPVGELDKDQSWYPTLLEVVSGDDIIILVIIRKLILECTLKPSLQHLFIGLKRHFDRELNKLHKPNTSASINPEQASKIMITCLAELSEQKARVLRSLSSMKRPPKSITVFKAVS